MKNLNWSLFATICLALTTSANADWVGLGWETGDPMIRNELPIESHYYANAIETKTPAGVNETFSFNFGTTPSEATVAIMDMPSTPTALEIPQPQQAAFPFTLAIVITSVAAILLTGFAAALRSSTLRSPTPRASPPVEAPSNAPAPKGVRNRSGKKSRRTVQSSNG